MSMGLAFWILYLLAVIFGVWSIWPFNGANAKSGGGTLVVMILIGLLGWKLFGAPIHG